MARKYLVGDLFIAALRDAVKSNQDLGLSKDMMLTNEMTKFDIHYQCYLSERMVMLSRCEHTKLFFRPYPRLSASTGLKDL